MPVNQHGNVDLFQPSMLPGGCTHIACEDAWKVAKLLGINYADACIGFMFGGGRAVPNIFGIVICKEMEDTFNESYKALISEQLKTERDSACKRAVGYWQKIVKASRVYMQFRQKQRQDSGPQSDVGKDKITSKLSSASAQSTEQEYPLTFDQL